MHDRPGSQRGLAASGLGTERVHAPRQVPDLKITLGSGREPRHGVERLPPFDDGGGVVLADAAETPAVSMLEDAARFVDRERHAADHAGRSSVPRQQRGAVDDPERLVADHPHRLELPELPEPVRKIDRGRDRAVQLGERDGVVQH